MWRSLVSRLNGVQEALSSNLSTRTTKNAWSHWTSSVFSIQPGFSQEANRTAYLNRTWTRFWSDYSFGGSLKPLEPPIFSLKIKNSVGLLRSPWPLQKWILCFPGCCHRPSLQYNLLSVFRCDQKHYRKTLDFKLFCWWIVSDGHEVSCTARSPASRIGSMTQGFMVS